MTPSADHNRHHPTALRLAAQCLKWIAGFALGFAAGPARADFFLHHWENHHQDTHRALLSAEGKPEKIWDKIVQGKIQQYYGQFCLMEQPFVKPVEGQKPPTVGQVVDQVSKKVGATLIPRRFVRLKVGEED
jgi:translation elongation factor EF-Ts